MRPSTLRDAARAIGFRDGALSAVAWLHDAMRGGEVIVWRYADDAYLDIIERITSPDELTDGIRDDLAHAAQRTLMWRTRARRRLHDIAIALGFDASHISPVQLLHEAIMTGEVVVWRVDDDALRAIAAGRIHANAFAAIQAAVRRTMAWL